MLIAKSLLAAALCAVIPLCAFAQSSPTSHPANTPPAASGSTSPTSEAPAAAELTKLLRDFLAGASRNDIAMHDRFWADDLIYTASAGRRFGKAELMRDVRKEAEAGAAEESATYTAENVRVQQYGTTAIVAFRLIGTTKKGDTTEATNYLNSGTFLKRDGQWRAVNWQATKMPADESAKK